MRAVVGNGLGASVATGRDATSSLHVQHGVALLAAFDGEVTVEEPGGRMTRGRVVLVPHGAPHAVRAAGTIVGMLFDPQVHTRVAGRAREAQRARVVDGKLAAWISATVVAHRARLGQSDTLAGIAGETARELGEASSAPTVDRRVQRVLAVLEDPTADRARLLRAAGVSEAHLQALFARDVGIPIRTYRVWQKTLAAVLALRRVDATQAAHASGFADLAHFSRACRRTLGYSPRQMQAALRAASVRA